MGIITMVASGKDGVGKSTVCVLLADAIAAMGKRVLVLELDSGLRSLDIISGAYGNTVFDIFDVINGRCAPDQAIVKAPSPRSSVYILSAPYRSEVLQGALFVKLVNTLSEEYDHLLIDTASLHGTTLAASAVSMNAILVATPDPVNIRDARIMNDKLVDLQVPNIRLLINRIMPEKIVAGIIPHLDYCIDTVSAQLIGCVPENVDIALAAAKGIPLPKKCFSEEVFSRIAQRLYGKEVPLAFQ